MSKKQKIPKGEAQKSGSDPDEIKIAKPLLDRIQAEQGIWCLVVRDGDTGEVQKAFLDYCSHKDIPLGPKAALTKKGQIRCPHHDVCFDCISGAVTDDQGKEMPQGLVPVTIESATNPRGDENTDDNLTLIITPEHRAYLSKYLRKRDKSRTSSTKTRRKEQNHAGDINKTDN